MGGGGWEERPAPPPTATASHSATPSSPVISTHSSHLQFLPLHSSEGRCTSKSTSHLPPTRRGPSMIEKGEGGFEGGSPYGYNGHNGHTRPRESPPTSPTPSSPTSSPKRASPPHYPPLTSNGGPPPPFSIPTSSPFPMPPFSRGAGDYLMASPIPELHYTGR